MAESLEHFAYSLARYADEGPVLLTHAMEKVALRVEAEMKVRAREGGVHKYGTKTTATPGRGPAVISGDLDRSITHLKSADGIRIGPAAIPHTDYTSRRSKASVTRTSFKRTRMGKGKGKATSGQIGEYLEPRYPFVKPALDAVKPEIDHIVTEAFREPMP